MNSWRQLMDYFGVTSIDEFQVFWGSLLESEKLYYRTTDLT